MNLQFFNFLYQKHLPIHVCHQVGCGSKDATYSQVANRKVSFIYSIFDILWMVKQVLICSNIAKRTMQRYNVHA